MLFEYRTQLNGELAIQVNSRIIQFTKDSVFIPSTNTQFSGWWGYKAFVVFEVKLTYGKTESYEWCLEEKAKFA